MYVNNITKQVYIYKDTLHTSATQCNDWKPLTKTHPQWISLLIPFHQAPNLLFSPFAGILGFLVAVGPIPFQGTQSAIKTGQKLRHSTNCISTTLPTYIYTYIYIHTYRCLYIHMYTYTHWNKMCIIPNLILG